MYVCFRKTHWIDSKPLDVEIPLSLNLTYRDYRLKNIQRLSFSAIGRHLRIFCFCFVLSLNTIYSVYFHCTGPDHITFLLSLYGSVKLKDWSLSSGEPLQGPQWNGRPTYFVYYACANDNIPWDFWIDLEVYIINV